ncbi:hypothetical protein ANN_10125 [Periplaneta americana]|uniref:Uncharacterized protein n=1 Tax=Periplaneta americana TaxID=6978 RepID=A0ABQ8TQJ8_PERAM|nr:hypothetical protein ANN_10125 [Periplaneta americana]
MSPESSTENYLAFAHIGLRENPEKSQPGALHEIRKQHPRGTPLQACLLFDRKTTEDNLRTELDGGETVQKTADIRKLLLRIAICLFNDVRKCRGYISVAGVPEFCPAGTIRLQSHGWGKPRKKPFNETRGGSNPSPNAAPDQQPSESAD